MRIKSLIGFLMLSLISCGRTQTIEDLRKNYNLDDLGIYLEKVLPNDISPNRYTTDNKVYTIGRKFIFDYIIIRNGDSLKIKTPKMTPPETDFQREWEFLSWNVNHEDKIETISITVLPGISNENQTNLQYEYQYPVDLGYSPFSSTSGVIENEMNTWMHPHRDKYFMILELNPFPFIQQPFKIGNSWTWDLGIGDHWGDNRWKSWTGSIKNKYSYKIIGRETIKSKAGEMECWVIESSAISTIGSTGLIAYFSEKWGFVRLDYINIDKSRLTMQIKEIR